MDIGSVIEEKKLQYSTVKNKVSSNSTVQYSYRDACLLVEDLDKRVYRDSQYLSFYAKAICTLGWPRMLELQGRVLNDKRIGRPELFNPEKVFAWLLRQEMNSKR